ncbi:hypothetical protein SS05631_c16660 [Sinorhizobium sp. CCBAU 05631]|nr:hypothetical protein SS05631_c16660 [Sinorhizobium sp. CCBAU 05631]AWM25077.1 hypothetical protein AOX55_00001823 [Sinorhizobium fredii CCBAU 25509]
MPIVCLNGEVYEVPSDADVVCDSVGQAPPGEDTWIEIQQAGILACIAGPVQRSADAFERREREIRAVSREIASFIACGMSGFGLHDLHSNEQRSGWHRDRSRGPSAYSEGGRKIAHLGTIREQNCGRQVSRDRLWQGGLETTEA